ncbi:hypothetical protein FB451DRAFT_1410055 [Mycena latifolia]|nr:hypothetical protein FB451DRAFT_1410055 [Mycena latifolia]
MAKAFRKWCPPFLARTYTPSGSPPPMNELRPEMDNMRLEITSSIDKLRQRMDDTDDMIREVKDDIREVKDDIRQTKEEISGLRAATLPLPAGIALRTGRTTLSLAHAIASTAADPGTSKACSTLLGQLRKSNANQKALATFADAAPVTNLEALRLASLLLSPLEPRRLGQLAPNDLAEFSRLLGLKLGQVEGERLANTILTTVGGQERDVMDQMAVSTFLAVVQQHVEAETEAQRPLSADWQELLWLWEEVAGSSALESSTQLSSADLALVLYDV